jgi:uncharacterized membrane protein YraQ (UPF0718 family)
MSVVKAAFLGVPLPLCSCGVLPAAVSLNKQGANKGATTAFLISTPESGVDSIALSYALLDPVMTVVRPVAAFITAITAGWTENLLFWKKDSVEMKIDRSCPVDGCCDGIDCPDDIHRRHHTIRERLSAGVKFGYREVWGDIAAWFFVGLIIAAFISAIIPDDLIGRLLVGGLSSMLVMLIVGIPIYICATASTPVAAALIMKGVSPGAALVFLLVGPATNITSLSVLVSILGKKSTAIYLIILSVCAVGMGLGIDQLYHHLGISPQAIIGQAAEMVPYWLKIIASALLLLISIRPLTRVIKSKFGPKKTQTDFVCGFPVPMHGSNLSPAKHSHEHHHDGCNCGH